ncbi:MAG TPA: hypothetical protein DCS93_44405 [Microscillaceae bacterium]|nr:hypothetical protein [Microscillaceae bacterium]
MLAEGLIIQMQAFGGSMEPLISSGSILTFQAFEHYQINDIVFCKVEGNFIDAHKIVEMNEAKGYLIGNNKGKINGWTKSVFGKVIEVQAPPSHGSVHNTTS